MARTFPADAERSLPVIVLHGWGASIDAVGSILGGLGAELQTVAVDLPGFGGSPPPSGGWSVDRYAKLVVELADHLGIERFHVFGHSFGARIALKLAAAHPNRVDRVLLTGAAGIKPRRRPAYYAKVAAAKLGRVVAAVGGRQGKRLQERIRAKAASSDWLDADPAMRETFRAVIAEELTPLLNGITSPVLLIWGENDHDTPLWMGERMERLIPDAGLVVLPGCGHYAYAEKPAEFNRIALHFFGGDARAETRT